MRVSSSRCTFGLRPSRDGSDSLPAIWVGAALRRTRCCAEQSRTSSEGWRAARLALTRQGSDGVMKEDDELTKATEALNAAFNDSPNPPPHFEEALETLSDSSTGVGEEELRRRREAFLARLGQGRSLGELLHRRR